ncbi:glutaminase A [Arthrobacter rhombi]|uniref:glutaminase A n=1 Tax=Arthrobacter rhombi TaxID=71253 RepID=UPI003F8E9DC9
MQSPIESYLRRLHTELSSLRDGTPYQDIPATSHGNPDDFAICLATVDGYVYEVGDADTEFSIQSVSKPFTYGLALEDLGPEAVDEKIDVEPSGDAFNEISLSEGTGRPANAMINAGAIAATSLIKGSGGRQGFERILSTYSDFAGRQLKVRESIYRSEIRTGHRNRAMANLLRSFNVIEHDPEKALRNYFRQCSVMVNARDLALMAATLANGGTQPVTGKEVMGIDSVQRVLSVMMTCGMYDDAGSWTSAVGMPAKSGVGGGLLAVLPGQLGLAVYSPPLNEHGSSVRGVAASERMATDMELHFVRAARMGRSVISERYDLTEAPSGVRHNDDAAAVLEEHGHRAQILELNGDLLFAGAESMVRAISALPEEAELVILDVRRVDEVGDVALTMLAEVRDGLVEEKRRLILIETEGVIADAMTEGRNDVPVFGTRNDAAEWAEEWIIALHGGPGLVPDVVHLPDFPAVAPLDPEQITELEALMEERTYDDGQVIRRVGQKFGGVYFILSGKVATTSTQQGHRFRHATLGAGMTFGEIALGGDRGQSLRVTAEGRVQLKVLPAEAIAHLEADDPSLALSFWKAVARDAYTRVEQSFREAAVRERDQTFHDETNR